MCPKNLFLIFLALLVKNHSAYHISEYRYNKNELQSLKNKHFFTIGNMYQKQIISNRSRIILSWRSALATMAMMLKYKMAVNWI